MEYVKQGQGVPSAQAGTQNNTGALIIVTVLFFMWGLLTSLNDVLIPHLRSIYTLTYVQAMLVQFCFFGAYAIVSLPAGMLIKKIGYQRGVVAGLLIAAAGCAMFYPASTGSYALFLLSFFILAAGITVLQVAANPYVTELGDPHTASSRLTLTQAFNALGTTVAPALGGMLILSGTVLTVQQFDLLPAAEQLAYRAKEAASVQGPYLVLAATLVILAVLFALAKLPKISHADDAAALAHDGHKVSIWSHRHLVLGALAIFLYVGGEVSIAASDQTFWASAISRPSHADAAYFVSYYLLGCRHAGAASSACPDALCQPGQDPGLQRRRRHRADPRCRVLQRSHGHVGLDRRRPIQLHHVPDHLQHGPEQAGRANGTRFGHPLHGHRRRRHRAVHPGLPGRPQPPLSSSCRPLFTNLHSVLGWKYSNMYKTRHYKWVSPQVASATLFTQCSNGGPARLASRASARRMLQ